MSGYPFFPLQSTWYAHYGCCLQLWPQAARAYRPRSSLRPSRAIDPSQHPS